MKATPLVDEQGHFIEDTLVEDSFTGIYLLENKGAIIATPVPPGLYRPCWNFNQSIWTEGLSTEEIAELQTPSTETAEQKIARLEKNDLDNKELIASLYEMVITSGGE